MSEIARSVDPLTRAPSGSPLCGSPPPLLREGGKGPQFSSPACGGGVERSETEGVARSALKAGAGLIDRLGAEIETIALRQGSTRAAALVRIIIALLILAKWSEEFALFRADHIGLIVLSPIYFGAALLMLAGFRTKAAVFAMSLVLGLLYFGYGKLGGVHEWAHHHCYMLLAVTALLNGAPCEKSYSVDRWLALRRAARQGCDPPAERGFTWAQRLIVLQMGALYFWTAIDKTEPYFLNGQRLERIFEWAYAGHPLYDVITAPPLLAAASCLVVGLEYFLGYALIAGRMKRAAFVIALGLHVLFYWLLKVDTYSATMIALYLLYADPDRVHRAIDAMHGRAA